ncbi:MAG: GyrI-like domain-containing protein [Ferruginibacter sp.]
MLFFTITIMSGLSACNSKKDNSAVSVKDSLPVIVIKHDTAETSTATQPPIINITDTLIRKQWVLYVKDSAASSNRINQKLAQIYRTILPGVANTNNIQLISAPMAWYKNQDMPFFFEAGFVINEKPLKKLPPKVFVKSIGGDSAVVAHFYGPYEIVIMGYETLNDWMKTNKKMRAGQPYEVYVTDPFTISKDIKNPYRIRTDIFIPHK